MGDLINTALSQYGVTELPGDQHNPMILRYFAEIGHEWATTDETAWCSAFMNWVALQCDRERSGKLNARSWLNIGEEIESPIINDLVIFWRESKNSWKGHVGLYVNDIGDDIYCLGGNQNNMVCVKTYPKDRLLGYRRLGVING
jgi:uncharacterized protein (TIGR02594 family)